MKVLVTGAAGFIGSALSQRLLSRGNTVIGIDNLNDYYDPQLKQARLDYFCDDGDFQFVKLDIADRGGVASLFAEYRPDHVVNLAAQPGVRYSLKNPHAYVDTNLVGFVNILEGCRHHKVKHLVFASSSSVYGANTSMPFSVHDNVDHPVSLYAASKKASELMAHSYSHLYQIPSTGLRFFTVYGPWGRPDMTPYVFIEKMMAGKPIDVFNEGKHRRDFTYIDDIVEGVVRVLDRPASPNKDWHSDSPDPSSSNAPYRIYNIGNHRSVELMHYIRTLEDCLGRKAEKNLLPMQPGDVPDTYADVDDLVRDFGYQPDTTIEIGMKKFVDWYLAYHGLRAD